MDINVSKPNHVKAISGKPLCSYRIVLEAIKVRNTIDFDNETTGGAIKIGGVSSSEILASEFKTIELPVSKHRPEFLLAWRRLIAHGTGALQKQGVDAQTTLAGAIHVSPLTLTLSPQGRGDQIRHRRTRPPR